MHAESESGGPPICPYWKMWRTFGQDHALAMCFKLPDDPRPGETGYEASIPPDDEGNRVRKCPYLDESSSSARQAENAPAIAMFVRSPELGWVGTSIYILRDLLYSPEELDALWVTWEQLFIDRYVDPDPTPSNPWG